MKLKNRNLLIIAALAIMTNGLSLLGFNYGSAGALARTIECNSQIAHNLKVAQGLKPITGKPPSRVALAFANRFEPVDFA
ncbi:MULTISPECIES: hypothetical protein [Pseudomonas]|uniref:Uncharacterized protein n=1 Tax=Pseudomonas segetis TaxID=298908 RepID=A0A239AA92_9PSED|nr:MULTISPECIES: hypothetical protein [Pseudomonas]SNR92576.1 hypothetical protein SAMN05216255_1033 [Pseudomonas segetis]